MEEKKSIYFQRYEGLTKVLVPKHPPMLNMPATSRFVFELGFIMFCLIVMGLQLVNIYKTVWWLENSFQTYTMHFYLINTNVLYLCIILLSQRFLYCVLCSIVRKLVHVSYCYIVERILRILLLGIIFASLIYLAVLIFPTSQYYHNMVALFYPIIMYFIFFGLKIEPFFDIETSVIKNLTPGKPYHCCSTIPTNIREEINLLKFDFNNKLKLAIFHSLTSGYYATIVPCLFTPNFVYYDCIWVSVFGLLATYMMFALMFIQVCPVSYLYILHQATMHLGKWTKIECRSSLHIPSHVWSENTLWPQGVLVKYNKEYYRGEGICNAAEPNNVTHKKFWFVFKKTDFILNVLLVAQLGLFVIQMVVFIKCKEWHRFLCIIIVMLANYYLIFYLTRIYFAFGKCKKSFHVSSYESCMDSAKLNSLLNNANTPRRKIYLATNVFIFIVVAILTVYSLSLCIIMFANTINVLIMS
uniref:Transmembrane protein 39A n=1 Tax=Cacopsylla melanoneura TaxID=428564 RepID=A0A8D8RFX7_9HEMI